MDNFTTDENLRTENCHNKKRGKKLFSRVREGVYSAVEKRKNTAGAIVGDLTVFVLGFIFSRCPLFFGAHPLAVGFISVLPTHVWVAALGAALGSLTLGRAGVIYALISLIVVFLRIVVSTGDKSEGEDGYTRAFSEGLLLRMSSALIGGFIAAVYEVILGGFTLPVLLYGGAMILLCPIVTFALCGLFDGTVTKESLIFDTSPIFSLSGKSEKEKYDLIFYQCSAVVLLYFTGLSLAEYSVYGIDLSYIAAGCITLLVSKRFGALRGAAAGFATALGLSSSVCVAFGLLGLISGVLFKIGIPYAIAGGGGAFVGWCAYSEGLVGVVSALPELLISFLLIFPLLKKVPKEKTAEQSADTEREAEEMISTVALSYKNKYSGALDSLESSLCNISAVLYSHAEKSGKPTEEELCELIRECMQKYCASCSGRYLCRKGGDSADPENVEKLSRILYKKGKIYTEDFDTVPGMCHLSSGLCEAINRAVAIVMEQRYNAYKRNHSSEQFDLISALIKEARHIDEEEKSLNESLTSALDDALFLVGLPAGSVKVFGRRSPHFIVAAEDEDGRKISSPELREQISSTSGFALSTPQFYRRGRMALMECGADRLYTVNAAFSSIAGERDTVSGDTAAVFESADGRFYGLISDGMGSGEEARQTSQFVRDFLTSATDFAMPGENLLKILNHSLRSRSGECSATVDLFSFDLFTGEGSFIKCGAAPSFIKKESSIIRVCSRTAPIGLMKAPDAEKLKSSVGANDYVVMFSDGVASGSEDAPWLLELLSKPPKKTPKEYSDYLLKAALENLPHTDDMTVLVAQIKRQPISEFS